MSIPAKLPEWDTTQVNIVEVDIQHKEEGWLAPAGVPEKPPFQSFNWWQNLVYQWVLRFKNITGGLDNLTELLSLDEKVDKTTVNVRGYTAVNDNGGGLFNYDSTVDKATANGGTIIDPSVSLVLQGTGTGTGCWMRQYEGAVYTSWFGAKGDGSDDFQAIQNAFDSEAKEIIIDKLSTVSQTLILPSGKKLIGVSRYTTGFRQSAIETPTTVVQTATNSEHSLLTNFKVELLQTVAAGTVVSKGIALLETRRSEVSDCFIYVDGHTGPLYSGIGIFMDMNTDLDAYTNRIDNNTVIACTYGLWSKGPITSSVFSRNHFKCLSGMRFDRESVQGGTTPIIGNQIVNNLIQSHSTDTWGTGNGIDFGQSDGGLGFTFAYSNQIGYNYIEQFEHGILLRDGASYFEIGSQEWDNPTNRITDLNVGKVGYSGFDAQTHSLSTGKQKVSFTDKGSTFTDKTDDTITMDGNSKTLDVTTDSFNIISDYRRIRVWGVTAARTGAVISQASAIEGQRITLIGFSWSVSLSTTGLLLNGGVGVNLGNGVGEVALIEFEFDASLALWIEVYRNTRV